MVKSDSLFLNKQFRKTSDYVAGYVVHKTENLHADCCKAQQSDDQPNTENIGVISRGGLKNPLMPL